jgi:hypothetical protein
LIKYAIAKMKNKLLYIIVLVAFYSSVSNAQNSTDINADDVVYGKIEDGDTIFVSSIEEVIIMPKPIFKSKGDYRRYQKMVKNVKRVYPYAKIAGQKYQVVEQKLIALETDKARKAYLKQVEKDIVNEYEDDLSKLTITQGRILIKLIDREIGETSYDLLKDFRGNFTAIFWQTLARIFGHNLKTHFDPTGEDKLLNEVLILIDNGQL